MENLRITKLQALGLFVIVTISAMFFVMNFLKGESVFKKQNTYYSEFSDVAGITISSPIYIKGYKVGAVESITYSVEKSNFLLELNVKADYSIPKDSKAEIYSADLMGSKAIRIDIGESKEYAEDYDNLIGTQAPDMINSLTEQIGPLAAQLSSVMSNLDTTLTNVNSILNANAREDIHAALDNLNKTLVNFNAISNTLANNTPNIEEIITNFNTLSKELSNSSSHITASLENFENITSQLSKAELEETINNLNNLLESLRDPNGSLGKLMVTDSLHNSVNTVLNNIDTLVQKITENPKKYIKVSVF